MKRLLLITLASILLGSGAQSFAEEKTTANKKEEKYVTSETITADDVRPSLVSEVTRTDPKAQVKEIFGIYQEGPRSAEVFWSATVSGKQEFSSTTMLRFNDGRWFNVDVMEFLTK